jgi:PAS domain S-box-containing protein
MERNAQALSASELRYRRLFESAKDGIMILDAETGMVVDVNPFLIELLGLSHEAFLGKTIWELGIFKDIAANEAKFAELQEQEYVRYEDLPLETAAGRRIAVEFVSNVYLVNRQKVIQCNVRDISARKLSEKALRENLQLLSESQRLGHIGSWLWDLGGPISWSEEMYHLYGVSSETFIPTLENILSLTHPDDQAAMRAWITACAAGERSGELEFRINMPDGTIHSMMYRGEVVREVGARSAHMAGTMLEITERKRANESLNLFRTLIDRSSDGIEVIDPETGRFLDINETTCKRLGYSRAEMLSMTVPEVETAAIAMSSWPRILEEIRKTGFIFGEGRQQRKDGSTFPVEVNVRYIKLNRAYMVAMVRDITERNKTNERLRLQSAALEAAANAVVITDSKGVIEWANPAFTAFTGYSIAEAIGKSSNLLKSGKHDEKFYQNLWNTISAGKVWQGELINRRKDGSLYTEEMTITPIRDNRDEIMHYIAVKQDITQRKLVMEQMQEQAALLDKAHDAITVYDLEGRIFFWNKGAERIYGWTREEAWAMNVSCLLSTGSPMDEAAYDALFKNGEWSGDLQHIAKDGRKLTVEARWTLLRDKEGKPKSIFSIVTDITERKQLEAQFLRNQRMESIGTLAGGIAHDLNNALAPILMAVEVLKVKVTNEADRRLLGVLEASAQHGANLVRQVLSFARGVEGERMMVNPLHLLNEIENMIRDTFPMNIDFSFTPSGGVSTVTGDPTLLHQVFTNLCVNARDAMPNGGTLKVTMENTAVDDVYAGMNPDSKPGDYVMVKVEDTGTGIPPVILDKIFEPFFTTKEIGKGTGLGLSTSMAIVKSHGGFIVPSSEMGKGTTFKVYLPADETSKADEAFAEKQTQLPRGNGELVLVVDDDENIRTIAQRVLEQFGYRVKLAANGAEAVEAYAQHREEIAIVLTDMAMPVMDGPSAIVALKAMNPQVRVIGSSGLASRMAFAQAAGAGFKYFIPKPFTAEAMLNILEKALRERV